MQDMCRPVAGEEDVDNGRIPEVAVFAGEEHPTMMLVLLMTAFLDNVPDALPHHAVGPRHEDDAWHGSGRVVHGVLFVFGGWGGGRGQNEFPIHRVILVGRKESEKGREI